MDTPTDNTSVAPANTESQPGQPATIGKLNKTVSKILASDSPLEYIEKAGIDLLAIYKGLNKIALYADIMAKDRDGDVFVLGADNRSRIMASTLILELAKHIKDKSTIQQIAIVNDPGIIEDAKRLRGMRG